MGVSQFPPLSEHLQAWGALPQPPWPQRHPCPMRAPRHPGSRIGPTERERVAAAVSPPRQVYNPIRPGLINPRLLLQHATMAAFHCLHRFNSSSLAFFHFLATPPPPPPPPFPSSCRFIKGAMRKAEPEENCTQSGQLGVTARSAVSELCPTSDPFMVPPGAAMAARGVPNELRLNLDLNIGPLHHPWPFAPVSSEPSHTSLTFLHLTFKVWVSPTMETNYWWWRRENWRLRKKTNKLETGKNMTFCIESKKELKNLLITNLELFKNIIFHSSLSAGATEQESGAPVLPGLHCPLVDYSGDDLIHSNVNINH